MQTVEQLYKLYEKPVFRYFYGLTTDYYLAEELTQETFFQVLRTIPMFRGDAQITTWLYKVARNVYGTWKRKKANHSLPLDNESLQIPDPKEPPDFLEQKEKVALLFRTLRQLPENYREVLWLREWQDLSYEEIAVITSHSVPWVKTTLHRARLHFRQLYGKEEGLI
ncbi:MAG: sigma-70 family RNA polymerase sigma factor [Desulfosporosinus sp.]|nr:sigma-70 family RNA polymerase sigma factor [Desulfosporosinus sp.]